MTAAPSTSPTVLLVEDSAAIRTLQRFLLARSGLAVLECPDLVQAEATLRSVTPDLVVLDLNLPDGHGLNLLRHIDRRRTRVLVMTGMTQQHTAEHSEHQADAFMPKPFRPEAFVEQVRALT